MCVCVGGGGGNFDKLAKNPNLFLFGGGGGGEVSESFDKVSKSDFFFTN